ncbi:MAG: PEP-CTERM sorting domain-containing protein [Actinomycetota bacterium]|nr:PEP-CTERM sorting domain-containing protein [Actinomycetota bacterium]
MRLFALTITTLAVLLMSSMASAYEIRLVQKGSTPVPTAMNVGEAITYEIYLDTEAAVPSNIVLFSASITFDPTVLGYNRASSDAEDYYPLYSPAVGKTIPATFLQPVGDPFGLWPAPPAGLTQVNIDFIESNLNEAQGTSTNEYLGEVTFNAVGVGDSNFTFSFDNGGNIFNVSNVDVSGTVSLVVTPGGPIVVPEPTSAALGLGALGAVGMLAWRRRRS